MNLLEHYIKEIHSVKEINDVIDGRNINYILVDVTVDCYGSLSRIKNVFSDWDEWNTALKDGYFMA